MKNFKRVLICLTALVMMILSLTSCGKEATESSDKAGLDSTETGSNTSSDSEHLLPELQDVAYDYSYGTLDPDALYFGPNKDNGDVFGDMKETIAPADVYKSIKYEPCMFYGYYKTDLENFKLTADYSLNIRYKNHMVVSSQYENLKVSSVPVEWKAAEIDVKATDISSPAMYFSDLTSTTDLDWVSVTFAVEENSKEIVGGKDTVEVICAYAINGNTVELRIADLQNGNDGKKTYTLSNNIIKYGFEFSGPYLTFNSGSSSVKLKSVSYDDLFIEAYSLPDSKLIGNTDNMLQNEYFLDKKDSLVASKRDATYYSYCDMKFCENGLVCIKLVGVDEDNSVVTAEKQCVYFLTGGIGFSLHGKSGGFVLSDGKDTYYYYDTATDRQMRINEGCEFKPDEVKLIEDLYIELATEFANNGIGAFINRQTGEICLDANVLFAPDKADITEDGKALLDRFAKVYYTVVFSGKYDGFISGVKVEGHSAPMEGSTYESGLELSKQRAENVMNYLESNSDGFDLSGKISAEGLSNSRPIYDGNGEVNLEACRRVSFR